MKSKWRPGSWRKFPIKQQPMYNNTAELVTVEAKLAKAEAIVSVKEVRLLRKLLIQVAECKAIVLHAGDCVENFVDINEHNISQDVLLITELAKKLSVSLKKNVVIIGRIAGQFAKPRSNDSEIRDKEKLPVYRGDIVNSIGFSSKARTPDANRLFLGYQKSVEIMRYLRNSKLDNYYTSHEALLLNYEQCFTRKYENNYYNLSASFFWIGNRTRSILEAHIEYIRGIHNPVGIKVDHNITSEEIIALIQHVNPDNALGRLLLIFRLGEKYIGRHLPKIISSIKKHNKNVILMCDPMHGNTFRLKGQKTRNINTILLELGYFIDILESQNMYFGGLHLEMTGKKVVECVNIGETVQHYSSYCDPRLNAKQSMQIIDFTMNKLNKIIVIIFLVFCLVSDLSVAVEIEKRKCHVTPELYTGLKRPDEFSSSNNLRRRAGFPSVAEGRLIYISGKVTDINCVPVQNARISIWHPNVYGEYQFGEFEHSHSYFDKNFVGTGSAVTDNLGNYNFITIFPNEYIDDPPFINFIVNHSDFVEIETIAFFSIGNERLKIFEKEIAERLVVTAIGENSYSFDIVLGGYNLFREY